MQKVLFEFIKARLLNINLSVCLIVITCLFLSDCVHTKQTFIDGIKEVDERGILTEGEYDISDITNKTYDGDCIMLYNIFNKDIKGIQQIVDVLAENQKSEGKKHKNYNCRSLMYFLHSQSILVDQISSPYQSDLPTLEEMNFDFQYHQDNELANNEKLNYLALMEFWKEYVCLYHKNSPKELIQIHDDYMRLLTMLVPKEYRKSRYLKSFEWINPNCKCSADKAAIFLNPVQRSFMYFLEKHGGGGKRARKEEKVEETPQVPQNTTIDNQDNTGVGAPISTGGLGAGGHAQPQPPVGDQPHAPHANPDVGQQPNPGVWQQPNPGVGQANPEGAPQANPDGAPQNNIPAQGPNAAGGANNAADPNPVGGGYNPFGGWNFFGGNNRGIFGSIWPSRNNIKQPNITSSDESEHIQYMRKLAAKNNDTNTYLMIGNEYVRGNPEKGVQMSIEKAKEYYKIAAERGNPQAMYNLGVLSQDSAPEESLEYFKQCFPSEFAECYIGAGAYYLNPANKLYNITIAIEYLEKAIELGDFKATSYLAQIYLFNHEVKNQTKGLEYLDMAIEKTDILNARLVMIQQLLTDKTLFNTFISCKRIYKIMKELLENPATKDSNNEILDWYHMGVQKEKQGLYDQALQYYSFAALNGNRKSINAVAEIWKNGLTQELTCQLGHPSLCAFVYYMQLFFFNNEEAGVKAARLLKKLSELMIYNSDILTEDALKLSKKLSVKIFDYLSSKNLEARFHKAEMIVDESPEAHDEALKIWDDMINESWNGDIDFRNFLPALISKYLNWF